jgi:hypothetical protein
MTDAYAGHGAAMAFSKGDKVSWKTSQGTTHGVVEEKRTSDFQHKGQKFKASDDEPAYIVRSDKSDETAAHKESALSKRS